MAIYAGLCGWTLARAHARSGDRIALAAYLGKSDKFDLSVADFAETYADQNENDYAALAAAVADGRAEARSGIWPGGELESSEDAGLAVSIFLLRHNAPGATITTFRHAFGGPSSPP